jgi:rhamnosyltransferase
VTAPLISIVLPTRNGMATLPGVVDAIARQRTGGHDVELIAIDTASSDGTAEFLRRHATRLIQIPIETFNHGRTRNEAIAASRGRFVVVLSQDAEPAHDEWLMRLTTPLLERPSVAGSFARQQPRPDAGAIARAYHAGWLGSSHDARVSRIESREAFERLGPLEQMRLCTFDNVCSCIRRDVWCSHPFPTTPIAEDLEWCRDVLLAGFEIEYVPDAVVQHSHQRSARYEFRRTALLHQRLHTLFGVRTIPTLPALARAVAATTSLHLKCRRDAEPGARTEGLGHALALAVAWPLGQYVGGRRAERGLAPIAATDV